MIKITLFEIRLYGLKSALHSVKALRSIRPCFGCRVKEVRFLKTLRDGAAPFGCEGSGNEAGINVAQCHLGEIV